MVFCLVLFLDACLRRLRQCIGSNQGHAQVRLWLAKREINQNLASRTLSLSYNSQLYHSRHRDIVLTCGVVTLEYVSGSAQPYRSCGAKKDRNRGRAVLSETFIAIPVS